MDPELAQAHRDLETASAHAAEAAHELRRYLQRVEPDPQRLEALERRLRAVHDAARRLRVDPAGLPEALASRRARLAQIGGDESLEALRQRESAARAALGEAARALSAKRREGARRLGEEVTRRLQGLAMEGGRLDVVLEPLAEPSAGGLEAVEFRVAAHAGQPAGPVGKVASGGELSRLALAIQVLMGGRAGIPTLVFDEVDAGHRRARGRDRGLAPRRALAPPPGPVRDAPAAGGGVRAAPAARGEGGGAGRHRRDRRAARRRGAGRGDRAHAGRGAHHADHAQARRGDAGPGGPAAAAAKSEKSRAAGRAR